MKLLLSLLRMTPPVGTCNKSNALRGVMMMMTMMMMMMMMQMMQFMMMLPVSLSVFLYFCLSVSFPSLRLSL